MHTKGRPSNFTEPRRGVRVGSRDGFSLIEVSLALMVLSLGLLGLFHLFPSGLRASYDATAETRLAQFADEVFNGLYLRGAQETASPGWVGFFNGSGAVLLPTELNVRLNAAEETLIYPPGSGESLRYRIAGTVTPDEHIAQITLRATYGRTGGIEESFYTEIYNYGL